jgi:peptide chain release factor 1
VRTGHQSVTLHVQGDDLALLDHEKGGHRLQRVPPGERKGRVHTSTVTVAVLDPRVSADVSAYTRRSSGDFSLDWFNGTIKAGGQHHQKNATCCRLTHVPTGLVKTAQSRSRANSQEMAMSAILAELDRRMGGVQAEAVNGLRKAQVGNGQRSELKKRTWRFQDDLVIDHVTGKRASAIQVMTGKLALLS